MFRAARPPVLLGCGLQNALRELIVADGWPGVAVQVGQPDADHLERVLEALAGSGRIVTPQGMFGRRDSPAHAYLKAPARQVVEHADLLDEPQRLVERQQHDQGTQADAIGALGCRG